MCGVVRKQRANAASTAACVQVLLECGEEARAGKAWEELLRVHPGNARLWLEHARFLQAETTLSGFHVDAAARGYLRALSCFRDMLEGRRATRREPLEVERNIVEVCRQYGVFLCQCGLWERAVATFQALAELSMRCPPRLAEAPLEEALALLEPFWDSGAPRFGDEGARGWAYLMEQLGSGQASALDAATTRTATTTQDAVPTIFQKVQSEQVASTSCGAISGLQSLPRTSLQKRKREHASPEATSSQTMSSPSSRAQLPLRKSPRLQAISVRPHLSQPVTSPIPKSPCKHLHTSTRKSLRKRKQDMSAPQTPSSVAASPWKSPRKCLQTATPVCASSRMRSEDQGATSPAKAAVKVQHKTTQSLKSSSKKKGNSPRSSSIPLFAATFAHTGSVKITLKCSLAASAREGDGTITPRLCSSDDCQELEDEIMGRRPSLGDAWLRLESLRDLRQWRPYRPDLSAEEVTSEDPERMVLYEDVGPALFRLRQPVAKLHLFQAWLSLLLGVDPEASWDTH
ncbi:hypothetical protein V5799_009868 [Amblyomma americanum]|uniref:Uncharacterized protein n=1 Tax=Amblyomma americanum TaxID=6943 RepID=A0AAQ4F998_AMBAM